MDKLLEMTLLIDFYGELLTGKQREIFDAHFLNDLSLNEISIQYNVSRQAVNDLLKRTQRILSGYEDKLGLIKQYLSEQENKLSIITYIDDILRNDTKISETERQRLSEIKKMLGGTEGRE